MRKISTFVFYRFKNIIKKSQNLQVKLALVYNAQTLLIFGQYQKKTVTVTRRYTPWNMILKNILLSFIRFEKVVHSIFIHSRT